MFANQFTDILSDILKANISQGTLILSTVFEQVSLEHIFSALHSKSNCRINSSGHIKIETAETL